MVIGIDIEKKYRVFKKSNFYGVLISISTCVMLICLLIPADLRGQHKSSTNHVYVDDNGVMRWEKNHNEVKGFGVNYTVPFAHAYRSAKRMGIDPKEAIDNDVYHFSRLGFDLYRLHVWDTEVSDTLGNLINNEHLKLFDYLLKKLKEKQINYIITPLAFWGNGWPEPDENSPGFSNKYGKNDCLTNPEAIKAQENYLYQFLNHVNPYTGLAYKNDPNLIAFEISNEPQHHGTENETTNYINRMVASMRKTECKKPIFYNVSHSVHLAEAYFKADIQGGTFQWYPTGLTHQKELIGNLLPNVDNYNIPFNHIIKENKKAKLVYEFDAADVGKSYMYPAMARSFRKAGIQLATQFAYDPTYLAYANTEYNTHYMNLVYTPQKALSLMISSEVFHQIPRNKDFGKYPDNTTFDDFKVDYLNDLAEYNSENKFIYTNNTSTIPKNEKKLKKITGFGNSPLVKYTGLGAYFFDKIDKGIWRLEVLPDAIWVEDPFGRNSLKKTVAVINWTTHNMALNIKDLGVDFNIEAINDDNEYTTTVANSSFNITPGTYILTKKGHHKNLSPNDAFGVNKLKDFYAPKTTVTQPWLKHVTTNEITENTAITLTVQFVAPKQPRQIQIVLGGNYKPVIIDMVNTSSYNYSGTIPAEKVIIGDLNYNIVVKTDQNKFITYPEGEEGRPFDWDFYKTNPYKIRVVSKENPVQLFNAEDDSAFLVREWVNSIKTVPTENVNESEYQVNIENLLQKEVKTLEGENIYSYSFKHSIKEEIKQKQANLSSKKNIVLKGRSLNDKSCKLEIAFIMNDGAAFGGIIDINPKRDDYILPIKDLKMVKTVTLPRPYPSFLPYYFDHNLNSDFNINAVESLQFSIGPGIPENEIKNKHGIAIISVKLE